MTRVYDPAGVLRELSRVERDMYVYRSHTLGASTQIYTRRYHCTLADLRAAACDTPREWGGDA